MILNEVTSSLEVFLSGAVGTDSMLTITYVDITTTTNVPSSKQTITNGITVVTVLSAPAVLVQRQVKEISVLNADAAPITITIQRNDNTVLTRLVVITLLPGYTLTYSDILGWKVTDSSGAVILTIVSPTVTVTDDTTTNAVMYPTWVTAVGGSLPLKVSTTKFYFNPSTGLLTIIALQFPTSATPATPAAGSVKFWNSTTNGIENPNFVGSNGLPIRISRDLISTVRNMSGGTLNAGDVVFVDGATGTAPHVSKAKSSTEATMPAIGIMMETVTNTNYGRVQRFGRTEFVLDTSAFAVGDYVYVSTTTAGALTATRPPHPNLNQAIGVIVVSHVTNGSIFVEVHDPQGYELGTNQNTFVIGDGAAGTKVLLFKNVFKTSVEATPTADRIVQFQDKSYTIAGIDDVDETINSYKEIFQSSVCVTAAVVAGTYIISGSGGAAAFGSGIGGVSMIRCQYLEAADFPTINGLTTKLKVRCTLMTNATAPTGDWYVALFPITGCAGGAGQISFTIGTEIVGSKTNTQNTPAASTRYNLEGADFAFPADGYYALCVVKTATTTANSFTGLFAQLQMRNN